MIILNHSFVKYQENGEPQNRSFISECGLSSVSSGENVHNQPIRPCFSLSSLLSRGIRLIVGALPLSLVNFVVEAPLSLPVAGYSGVIFSLARTSHAIGVSIATVVNHEWKILPEDLGSSRVVIILLRLMFVQTLDTSSSFPFLCKRTQEVNW